MSDTPKRKRVLKKKTAKPIKYSIEVSKGSVRKYPNTIWFPRSKTDPREIREVLKIAAKTQDESPGGYFNDKLLGVKMAQIGSISVVGLDGDKYIESYKNKSTGNVSFITNARMLMRLFRFLGLVTRKEKGHYVLTDLGRLYTRFFGDFPSYCDGMSEEKILLECLANFIFYSVGDDKAYRDPKFRIRPFLWLLHSLALEPQCIYQLIVTAFTSRDESLKEEGRISEILEGLRAGKTTLKNEWKKVDLAPDNYSCVHNFYDSVKILVYLGISLGLIEKTSDPEYGKRITGKARHLKQATIFYQLTEKGQKYLEANLPNKLVYYDELYSVFGDEFILPVCLLLASLNFRFGKISVARIHKDFFKKTPDLEKLIDVLENKFGITIDKEDDHLSLRKPVSFSFYQHIPPEILAQEYISCGYNELMKELKKNKLVQISEDISTPVSEKGSFVPYFELDSSRRFVPAKRPVFELEQATRYPGMDAVFGGKDRFSGRVSPTNSIVISNGTLYVDQERDALDLLVPLRLDRSELAQFVEENLTDLLDAFIQRSDTWEKDQHYTWVRNVFRYLGMEALYSGSGGMLSRADVSVLAPFIAGIEAKSPRENRGTLNTKAIRQAVDAKIQVAVGIDKVKEIPRAAIAVGRRVSDNAIKEEQKWAAEGQPVLLINDAALQYLVLKSVIVHFSLESLTKFFTKNHGLLTRHMIVELIKENTSDQNVLERTEKELKSIEKYMDVERDDRDD